MNIFTSWEVNLIGFLISVVIFLQGYKLAVKNVTKDGAATILLQAIATLSILLVSPLYTLKFPENKTFWLFLLGACVFYAISDRLNTTVRKHLPVSTYTILLQLNTVFLTTIGFLFFKEKISLLAALG